MVVGRGGRPGWDKHGAETGPFSHLTLDLGLPGIQGVALSAPLCVPGPSPRPPRGTLTCSAPEPGTRVPSQLACVPGARQADLHLRSQAGSPGRERPASTSAPLPPHTPHLPCSDRRLPPAAALTSPAPGPESLRPPGTQSNGNAAAGAVPQLGGRGVSMTPILGLGQMEGKSHLGVGCLPPEPQEEPALPSFPSIPHPLLRLLGWGQSLNTLSQYFLSPCSGLGVV